MVSIRGWGDLDLVPLRPDQDPFDELWRRGAGKDRGQDRRGWLARLLDGGLEVPCWADNDEQPADGCSGVPERVQAPAWRMHNIPGTGRGGLPVDDEGELAFQDDPTLVLGDVTISE